MITTGIKARKQMFGLSGGPRSKLKAKHGGKYVERLGVMGGKTKGQKIAAREEARKRRNAGRVKAS